MAAAVVKDQVSIQILTDSGGQYSEVVSYLVIFCDVKVVRFLLEIDYCIHCA